MERRFPNGGAGDADVGDHVSGQHLRTYVVVWCVSQVALEWRFGSLSRQTPYDCAQLALTVLLLLRPSSKPLTCVAFLARCGGLWTRLPNAFDAEFVACLSDVAVVAALATGLGESGLRQVIRTQLGLFYAVAALWKVNSSFLNPAYSCGTTYAVQLLVAFGASSLVVRLAVRAMAVFTILLEASVGLAALFRYDELSVLLAMALHAGIALTPPPNNVAGFGVVTATRFFWLLKPQKKRRWLRCLALGAAPGTAVLLGATLKLHAAASQVQTPGTLRLDWPAGIFGGFAGFLVAAVALDSSPNAEEDPKTTTFLLLQTLSISATVAWSVVSIVLGVLDGASPNMFSNVRMSRGSNHLFLPTGLLQVWKYGDPASNFGGGVLRVHESNSSLLNAIHPGELTALLSDEAVRVLRHDLGHAGRFYNSAVANVVGHHVMPPVEKNLPLYTVPAFELHRVLRLSPRAPLTVTLTKLDGPVGDEHWRRHSGNRTVSLVYSPSYPHLHSCTLLPVTGGRDCDPAADYFHDTFLAAARSKTFLNFLGDKLQMWNSYVNPRRRFS